MTEETMQEPPGGENHGRKKTHVMTEGHPRVSGAPLDGEGLLAEDLLSPEDPSNAPPWGSGFGVVDTSRGRGMGATYGTHDAGMRAHRGVLAPGEYVDTLTLREAILTELGVTYPEFTGAYKNGRPMAEQREQREKIDAQLLALSRAGTNLARLAEGLGVSEKTIDRAIRRAEDVEVVPIVRNPAVVAERPCFICERPGRPRKRKSPDTPAHLRGTVVLCDDHYAKGFEHRKGNPAYWAFRDRLATPKGAYA